MDTFSFSPISIDTRKNMFFPKIINLKFSKNKNIDDKNLKIETHKVFKKKQIMHAYSFLSQ